MTNTSSENVTMIQNTYAAFARGDVDAVVDAMNADISWDEAEHSLWHKPGLPRTGRPGSRGADAALERWMIASSRTSSPAHPSRRERPGG